MFSFVLAKMVHHAGEKIVRNYLWRHLSSFLEAQFLSENTSGAIFPVFWKLNFFLFSAVSQAIWLVVVVSVVVVVVVATFFCLDRGSNP